MTINKFFPEIHGNFGFGCMRLPMRDGEVDAAQFCEMTDAFLDAGLNYFDTAHGYLSGKSETAIRACVVERHPRESFVLTDKLTDSYFEKQEDIRPFFEQQLAWCGVDYLDFYLMHAQDKNNYPKFMRCKAYETCLELKAEGKIRHFGISFHDKAEVLDRILSEHPEIEIVQIQFNYVDYEDASVESRKVYEVCEKYHKPVIVMEPVKGGNLVNLPGGGSGFARPQRRQQRKLCDPLCGELPEHGDGAFRHERHGADAGQPLGDGGLPSAERNGTGCGETGLRDLPAVEPHPLHVVPLLRRAEQMPEEHPHPGHVLLAERARDVSRLEFEVLLRQRRDRRRSRQGVGVHRMRQVRKGLPAAPADPQAAEGCSKRV